jgi:nitrous oxidase accessory protein
MTLFRHNIHGHLRTLGVLACLLAGSALGLRAQEIHVSPDGPVRTLTEALEMATPGTRIVVGTGVYREPPLFVQVPVEIVGIGDPVLDGENQREIMTVRADGVHISGLTFRGSGVSNLSDNAALRFDRVRGGRVENSTFLDNFFGIYIAESAGIEVVGNRLASNATREATSGNGVHLWRADSVLVIGNTITGHRDGVYLEFSSSVTVEDNLAENNLRYGLHFMFSNDCRYAANTFRRNAAGVAVMYSRRVEMVRNTIEHNWGAASYGLLLKDITDSEIRDNRFTRNSVALMIEGSDRMTISGNEFALNGWAVRIMSNSIGNTFEGNDFLENTFDVATNSRRNPNTFIGNYWSRYDGYDLTGDGRGDVAFRPVRLFALIAERHPSALILLRSFFVDLLDLAERVLPALTPETLVDDRPSMRRLT